MQLYCHVRLNDTEQETIRTALGSQDHCAFAQDLSPDEQQAHCRQAEVIFGNVPADWLLNTPSLRWLQLNSAGLNPYNKLDWSERPGVVVTNLHGFYGQSCAETALAGILALYRGVIPLTDYQRKHEWIGSTIRPSLHLIAGKHALVLGAGSIGRTVGTLLSAFGCTVTYLRRSEPPTFADIDKLLSEADLVVGTLPETTETIGLLNAGRLQQLKTGSLLVNVGRGSLVDEPALIKELTSGRLAGAVLDVTAEEPLPADSPLWQMKNVVLTQHTSGGYAEEKRDMVAVFVNNLRRYQQGQSLNGVADLGKGY